MHRSLWTYASNNIWTPGTQAFRIHTFLLGIYGWRTNTLQLSFACNKVAPVVIFLVHVDNHWRVESFVFMLRQWKSSVFYWGFRIIIKWVHHIQHHNKDGIQTCEIELGPNTLSEQFILTHVSVWQRIHVALDVSVAFLACTHDITMVIKYFAASHLLPTHEKRI